MVKNIQPLSVVPKKYHRGLRKFQRHPVAVPVVTFFVLFAFSMVSLVVLNSQTSGANDSHVVHVQLDGPKGDKEVIPTRADNVGDFLNRANIKIGADDVVEPDKDTPINEDGFQINVYKARPATIVDGSHKIPITTAQIEPRTVVEKAGVPLNAEDSVRIATAQEARKSEVLGQHIIVERSFEVLINLYGNEIKTNTRSRTVEAVLKEKNIKPATGDVVTPAAATEISAGSKIFVTRMGTQIASREEVIPAPVQYIDDPSLALGATSVRQAGSDGKKLVTFAIETQNGKEVKRTVIQEVIVVAPVPKIAVRGTKVLVTGDKLSWMQLSGLSPNDYQYADYVIGRESGWCPTKWQGEYGTCPAYHGTPPSYLGYGLCQATPGTKMATAGGDWATNPVTQLRWCTGYAQGRYGSWAAAYSFWVKNHWW